MHSVVEARLSRHALTLLLALALALPAAALAGGVAGAQESEEGILPIGEVQGAVEDDADGREHRSPFAPESGNSTGETVTVQGVITQRTLARSSSGGDLNGFFVQNTEETADGDENSSDGIFVFHSGFDTLRVEGGDESYEPQVGDEVVLRGPVSEFFNLTQLSNPFLVDVVWEGVDVEEETPPVELDPPDDFEEAGRYFERIEGMQSQVPSGSVTLNGRDTFSGTLDGELWVARGDSEIAQREEPYERRAFRDAHPLDNNPDENFDDFNGYRIVLGSLGVKAAAGDNTAQVAPGRTFDTLENAPTGGVYYSFGKYQIQVEDQPELSNGADPSENAPPEEFPRDAGYSVVSFNVENLYDFRDDPNSGCDFNNEENEGCSPEGSDSLTVTPPFGYVPDSDEEYQSRLEQLAGQIVEDLHSPDVVMLQEVEDQDICTTTEDRELQCFFDGRDDVDGEPDTVQELALAIERLGGPRYEASFDRDTADTRGITQAYLHRADRVELMEPDPEDPVLGSDPQVEYRGEPRSFNDEVANPKALDFRLPDDVDCSTGCVEPDVHARSPQVGLFRVWRDGVGKSTFTDLYLVNNHQSAGPDRRVEQRTEQADVNAAIFEAIEAADPDTRVGVGGDLNTFPRPDDPFRPGEELFGETDQLGPLYEAGLTNLYDVLIEEEPASAYTFVFQEQAQTLDHLFLNDALFEELEEFRISHTNTDWPFATEQFGSRGGSDHDPLHGELDALPDVERVHELVRFFSEQGELTDERVERRLLDRLDRAERLADRGQGRPADNQLQGVIREAEREAGGGLTGTAADAIVAETQLLRESR